MLFDCFGVQRFPPTHVSFSRSEAERFSHKEEIKASIRTHQRCHHLAIIGLNAGKQPLPSTSISNLGEQLNVRPNSRRDNVRDEYVGNSLSAFMRRLSTLLYSLWAKLLRRWRADRVTWVIIYLFSSISDGLENCWRCYRTRSDSWRWIFSLTYVVPFSFSSEMLSIDIKESETKQKLQTAILV